ncbi:flagellar export protein FliJ [Parashewanella spongiae]|uniref:Flagellar FliJ protein n=1 Tax=Parashewanella spongiae TaxID=342950 RepID=A0A3A6U2A2_9GAMM|nr:flagellar export protein FliJ [Parashewanella spongiae]MCL1076635.1 flagellar export protein FliJ [Parashewanella spongiae]RJY19588.1 flagellar export protein FliJ [Parashewanella spongiae]
MVKKDPLQLVLQLAKDAEEQASLQLRSAKSEHQKARQQLDSLNNYRLEYMQQMSGKVGSNLSASQYHQFHRFVGQIDQAVGQQVEAVKKAEQQQGYRQQYWMEKQQKRKAVEMLLEKKAVKQQVTEAKSEQKLIDEFAIQQLFRNKKVR